jgi:hypothetical protein
MPYKDKEVKKAKHKEWSRAHYEANKEATKAKIKERIKRNKKQWDLYKSTLKCSKCSFSHIAALDFHHVDPSEKKYVISALVSNKSFTKAMNEAKKCIVLCANCHRIHHYEEKNLTR